MKVEQNNKTLYHVQSVTDYMEEPYDMFVYSANEADINDKLRELYKRELDASDDWLDDLIENSNIYVVYAENL